MKPSVEQFWQFFNRELPADMTELQRRNLRLAFFAGAYSILRGLGVFVARGGRMQAGMADIMDAMIAECRPVIGDMPEQKGDPKDN